MIPRLLQQEIDLIEEDNGKLTAFECKWNIKFRGRFPETFTNNYPGTDGNFEEFLL